MLNKTTFLSLLLLIFLILLLPSVSSFYFFHPWILFGKLNIFNNSTQFINYVRDLRIINEFRQSS